MKEIKAKIARNEYNTPWIGNRADPYVLACKECNPIMGEWIESKKIKYRKAAQGEPLFKFLH